jgi:hypothetical protein
MEFRTPVTIPTPPFQIEPLEVMLFVGSCFADNIGQRFVEEKFRATVNPYGTMYKPASVLHTVERFCQVCGQDAQPFPRIVSITLGTNHIYRLKATGEIVDNCQKRPQQLFREEVLSVDEIVDYLRQCVETLRFHRPDVQVVFTVSPIRYAKYGFHESQLSKASLLLAVDQLLRAQPPSSVSHLFYFPAYELVLDELRDYRFYKEDMLHPSAQAVEYLWQQLVEHYFSPSARRFLQEWKPIKAALSHRPFHPDSEEYRRFLADAQQKERELLSRYSH